MSRIPSLSTVRDQTERILTRLSRNIRILTSKENGEVSHSIGSDITMFYIQLSSNEDKLNEIIESSDSFLLPLASLSPDRLNTQHITDHLSIFDLVLKQTTKNDYESDEFRGDSILANVSKSIFMVLISYSNKFSSLSSSVIETLCYFVNSVLEFFITHPNLIDLWFIKLIYDQDIVVLNPSVTRQYFPIQDLLHELLLGGDYPISKLERLFILYLSATNTSKELKIWIADSDFVSTVVNCFLPILNLLTSKENLFASFRQANGDIDVILQDPDYIDYMNYTEFILKLIGQTTDEAIIGKFLSALKKDIIDKRIESYEVGNVSYDSPSFYLLATLLGKLLIQHDIGVLTTSDKLIISDLISHYFKDPNSKLFQTFKKAYIGSDSLSLQSIGSYHLIHQMLSSRPFPLVAELVTDSRFSEHYDRSKPSTSLNYVSIVELGSKLTLLCAEDQSLSSSEPLIEKLKGSFTDIMEDVIETKGPLDLSNCMFYRFEPTKMIPQLILSKFINFFNTDPSITARTVSLVHKLSTSCHLRLTNLFLNDYGDIDNPHHSDHIVFLQTFHYLSDCYEIYSRIAKESNLKNTPIKRETPGEELRSLIRQTVFDSDIHRHIEKTAYADTHFSSNTDLIENLRLYEGFLSTLYTTYQARNMLYGIFPKSKRTDSTSSTVAPPVFSI